MSECNCDMRTKLTGDGCEICNSIKALEYAKETIEDLTQQLEETERKAGEMRSIGQQMSNACYNLSQNPMLLEDHKIKTLINLYEKWDDLIRKTND